MGRFYKTANAMPVDYMYRINAPLMERVINTNDRFITQNLEQASALGQLANYNYINTPEEEADANLIRDKYTQQVNDISASIRKDPSNWRKQLDPIRNLKTQLQADYTNGPISKQVANYNRRKQAFDAVDKQTELWHTSGGEKGVDPTRATAYKANWDKQFTKTGYDPNNPSAYSIYKGGSILDNINIKKVLSEGLDKIKADKTKEYHTSSTGNDWYLDTVTNERVEVTPERILQASGSNLTPQIMQMLQQDKSVGLIGEGVDINPANAYKYNPVGISEEEQSQLDIVTEQIKNTKDTKVKQSLQNQLDAYTNQLKNRTRLEFTEGNYFAPILSGLVSQYANKEVTSGNELKNNTKGSTIYKAAQDWAEQTRSLKQQKELHDDTQKNLKDKFDKEFGLKKDKFEEEKWQFRNPQAKPGTSTSTKPGTKAKVDINPVETTVSRLATNSFENLTTYDLNGKKVQAISTVGLSADIERGKESIDILNSRLKEIDKELETNKEGTVQHGNLLDEKANISEQLVEETSNLNEKRGYYKLATDAVLSNNPKSTVSLSKDEVDLYKEFDKDRDAKKFKESIANLKKQYPDKEVSTDRGKDIKYVEDPIVVRAKEKLQKYLSTKSRVDQGREDVFSEIRKSYISTDAIVPNKKENDEVVAMLLNNTQGLQLYDDAGKKASADAFGGTLEKIFGGAGYTMNFQGTNSLKDYIELNDVGVNIEQIGGTTAIGNGTAVIKVTFDDKTGGIPKGKPFYISTSPEMQKDIATKFKTHKNPAVAAIANNIGDDEANSIRNQLATPATRGIIDRDQPFRMITIVDNKGNKIPLKVVEGKNGLLNITSQNDIPFLRVDDNMPGSFKGSEDFIQQLKAYKALPLEQQKELYQKYLNNVSTTR